MRRRWLWWTIGMVGVFLALYTAYPGVPPAGPDNESALGGTYTVNGVDPTGAEYSGTVVIRGTDDPDRYQLEWIITGTIRAGEGRHTGDRLEVTWESRTSASGPAGGTASYRIQDDGRLVGVWTVETGSVAGGPPTGAEELFPEP